MRLKSFCLSAALALVLAVPLKAIAAAPDQGAGDTIPTLPGQGAGDAAAAYGPDAGAAVSPDQEAGDTIPTLPYQDRDAYGYPYGYSYDRGFSFDLSAAYQAFLPTNSSFRRAAGTAQNAFSLGLAVDDVFLADMAFWQQGVNGLGTGTAQSLDYAGTDVALVWPFHLLDRHLCLYLGPGGRFGEITVNDPALDAGGVGFGSNAFTAVAGVKWKADCVGLDLRYTYDLVYSYGGFNTLRLGAFYEFGD